MISDTDRLQRKRKRIWMKTRLHTRQRWQLVRGDVNARVCWLTNSIDAKAKKELADNIKGKKGPINTGGQGIKKSGKK